MMRLACSLLLLIALVSCTLGLYRLGVARNLPFACDLYLRWAENRAVASGQSPFDPAPDPRDYRAHFTDVTDDWLAQRASERTAVYPPWSYALSMPFVLPAPWNAARLWFTAWSFAAIVGIAATSWCLAMRAGANRTEAALVSAAALSGTSLLYCLSNGQYGLLVAALLLASLAAWTADHRVLAGMLLGFASIKPNLTILFFLVPLVRRDWKVFGSGCAVVLLGTLVTCLLTRMDPLAMLAEAFRNTAQFVSTSQTLLPSLVSRAAGRLGVSILMASVALITAAGLLALRRQPLPTQFAVCAVASLFWTYCKAYDFPVLTLLLVALAVAYVQTRDRLLLIAAAACTAAMLLPLRILYHNRLDVQFLYAAVWLASLVVLLARSRTPLATNPQT